MIVPGPRATSTPGRHAQPDTDWLADLARQLGAEADLDAVWGRVVLASVAQVEGAEHAGITVLSSTSVSTPVASDDLVRAIDHHQYTIGEGPCLTASATHHTVVRVDDLTTDQRWPRFAAEAVDLGVRSMLSFRLYTTQGTGTETIGALNLYATAAHTFTDESVHTGTQLAAHAAVAAAATTRTEGLRIALQSRDVIGQAKGILMERYALTAQQAFDLLIAASQRTQRKLRDLATELTETGQLAAGTDDP